MSKFMIGTAAVPEIRKHQTIARKPTYPWAQILGEHRDTYFQAEVTDKTIVKVQSRIANSGQNFCKSHASDMKVVSRRLIIGNKFVLRFWLKDKTWGQREVEQEQPQERQVAAAVA